MAYDPAARLRNYYAAREGAAMGRAGLSRFAGGQMPSFLGGAANTSLAPPTPNFQMLGNGVTAGTREAALAAHRAPGTALELYQGGRGAAGAAGAASSAASEAGGLAGQVGRLRGAFSPIVGADGVAATSGLAKYGVNLRGAFSPAGLAGGAAIMGGNALDDSSWLDGREGLANDTTSKVLKWGGAGAIAGTMIPIPGVSTLVGAGVGAGLGLAHVGLERAGILGSGTSAERIDEARQKGNDIAYLSNLPESYMASLNDQLDVAMAVAESPEEKEGVAEMFRQQVAEAATAFAQDPTSIPMSEEEALASQLKGAKVGDVLSSNSNPDQIAAGRMAVQANMGKLIEPYAIETVNRANAVADMLEAQAKTAGSAAPILLTQAAQSRANGQRDAGNMIAATRAAPAVEALENQAAMLKSQASNVQQQAMAAVADGSFAQYRTAQQQASTASQSGGLGSMLGG